MMSAMKYSYSIIMRDWRVDNTNQRFGQYFCNKYISQPWPTLFYAPHDFSCELIKNWLEDCQYEYSLPPLRKKEKDKG
jgi:hypothetical protein